jgi:hypothetical protein
MLGMLRRFMAEPEEDQPGEYSRSMHPDDFVALLAWVRAKRSREMAHTKAPRPLTVRFPY